MRHPAGRCRQCHAGWARHHQAATIRGEIYELFPVLKEMLHRRGSQQQQLAIARALLADGA